MSVVGCQLLVVSCRSLFVGPVDILRIFLALALSKLPQPQLICGSGNQCAHVSVYLSVYVCRATYVSLCLASPFAVCSVKYCTCNCTSVQLVDCFPAWKARATTSAAVETPSTPRLAASHLHHLHFPHAKRCECWNAADSRNVGYHCLTRWLVGKYFALILAHQKKNSEKKNMGPWRGLTLNFFGVLLVGCAPFKRLDKQTAHRDTDRDIGRKKSRSGLYWFRLVQSMLETRPYTAQLSTAQTRPDQTTKWVSYLMAVMCPRLPRCCCSLKLTVCLSIRRISLYLRLKFFDWIVANCLQIYFDSVAGHGPHRTIAFCLVWRLCGQPRRYSYLTMYYMYSNTKTRNQQTDMTLSYGSDSCKKTQRLPQNSCRGFLACQFCILFLYFVC